VGSSKRYVNVSLTPEAYQLLKQLKEDLGQALLRAPRAHNHLQVLGRQLGGHKRLDRKLFEEAA